MMESTVLSELFDRIPIVNLSEETKSSCKRVSDYFGRLIHQDTENVFSIMASGGKKSFAHALKMSIPGEDICEKIEQIRKSLFDGTSMEEITTLYFDTINQNLNYVDCFDHLHAIQIEDAVEALLAFYETYAIHCFTMDDPLYQAVKNGESASFRPFFEEYLQKFREQMKDIMWLGSFGAERNYEASYRKTTYKYIELLLCYVVSYTYRYELSSTSFERFTQKLTKEIVCDSEAFYQLWLAVNNEVIEEAYAEGKFADNLFALYNAYNELIAETKQLYEANLGDVPLVKESDMRELYKTIYELRKELDEVKKELEEVKRC